MYLDANNLYGWAMSQPLPTGEFDWLTEEKIATFNVEEVPDDSEEGYILEVDLSYPTDLHDLNNDYPLAPEKMKISSETLSSYCRELSEKFDQSTTCVTKFQIFKIRKSTSFIIETSSNTSVWE